MDPEIVIAIDPKLAGSGYAVARGTKLVHVGLARVPRAMRDLEGRIEHQARLIAHAAQQPSGPTVIGEFPVVYPGDRNVADPNDLVQLAGLVCGVANRLRPGRLLLPKPREWKGTISKDVHHARLVKAHPRAEALIRATGYTGVDAVGDMWDAVGLLVWYTNQCALEAEA